jgi:Nickel/cobalt transporter regulator
MIMKKIILAALVAATVLTPIAAQAANVVPNNARNAISDANEVSFQRGEDRRGEGRRGGGEGRRGGEGRAQRAQPPQQQQQQAPQVQVQQEQRTTRNRSQDGNAANRVRGDGQRGEYRRQGRQDAQQDGRYYDRNRDGNLDRRWDRNRDGNLDRSWDRNRDGRLDRRYDRNDDERIDRRYDQNRNGQIDRRYDRNNDDRLDRSYQRSGQWSNNWRNDRRYDWRSYRNQNRSYYSPGRYYSPYRGRSYSRLNIGLYLGSGYYGSRYWINDPWQYRLPAAYGPYRWVRYYDDVILIDIRNGRVVDVIHDFFW